MGPSPSEGNRTDSNEGGKGSGDMDSIIPPHIELINPESGRICEENEGEGVVWELESSPVAPPVQRRGILIRERGFPLPGTTCGHRIARVNFSESPVQHRYFHSPNHGRATGFPRRVSRKTAKDVELLLKGFDKCNPNQKNTFIATLIRTLGPRPTPDFTFVKAPKCLKSNEIVLQGGGSSCQPESKSSTFCTSSTTAPTSSSSSIVSTDHLSDSEQTVQKKFKATDKFCPALENCMKSIEEILPSLTPSAFRNKLREQFQQYQIYQVCDIATESSISLPAELIIYHPRSQTVRDVLNEYLQFKLHYEWRVNKMEKIEARMKLKLNDQKKSKQLANDHANENKFSGEEHLVPLKSAQQSLTSTNSPPTTGTVEVNKNRTRNHKFSAKKRIVSKRPAPSPLADMTTIIEEKMPKLITPSRFVLREKTPKAVFFANPQLPSERPILHSEKVPYSPAEVLVQNLKDLPPSKLKVDVAQPSPISVPSETDKTVGEASPRLQRQSKMKAKDSIRRIVTEMKRRRPIAHEITHRPAEEEIRIATSDQEVAQESCETTNQVEIEEQRLPHLLEPEAPEVPIGIDGQKPHTCAPSKVDKGLRPRRAQAVEPQERKKKIRKIEVANLRPDDHDVQNTMQSSELSTPAPLSLASEKGKSLFAHLNEGEDNEEKIEVEEQPNEVGCYGEISVAEIDLATVEKSSVSCTDQPRMSYSEEERRRLGEMVYKNAMTSFPELDSEQKQIIYAMLHPPETVNKLLKD